jgi:hypothetical protein
MGKRTPSKIRLLTGCSSLSGHLKTGKWWSGKIRPTDFPENEVGFGAMSLTVRQVRRASLAMASVLAK